MSPLLRALLPTVLVALCACRSPATPAPKAPEPAPPPPAAAPPPTHDAEVREARRLEEDAERVDVEALERGDRPAGAELVEIAFASGSATLTSAARARLDALAERLAAQGEATIEATPQDASAQARALARQRAEAVRDYLHADRGIALARLLVSDATAAKGTTVVRLRFP